MLLPINASQDSRRAILHSSNLMEIEGAFRRKLGTACTECRRKKTRCVHNTPSRSAQPRRPSEPITHIEQPQPGRARAATVSLAPRAADEGLTDFYEKGITSRDWEVFHDSDPIRIVYLGDASSNLYHLVQSEDPERLPKCLHYPYPSRSIKPLLPWRPQPGQVGSGAYLTVQVADDLASFPAIDVRDHLVQTVSSVQSKTWR